MPHAAFSIYQTKSIRKFLTNKKSYLTKYDFRSRRRGLNSQWSFDTPQFTKLVLCQLSYSGMLELYFFNSTLPRHMHMRKRFSYFRILTPPPQCLFEASLRI